MRAAIDKYAKKVNVHNSVQLGGLNSPKTANGNYRSREGSPFSQRQHLQTAGFVKKTLPPFKVKKTMMESFQSTKAETLKTSTLNNSRMGMANNTLIRRDQWVDVVRTDPDMLHSIAEGSTNTAHPDHYSFRQKSEKANIYVRNHLSSVDRANFAEFKHKTSYLPQTLYKKDDPIRKYFLRPKIPMNDSNPVQRYQP